MFTDYNDIITIKELCTMLHIGRNKAYELVHSGAVRGIQIGRQIRISKKDIIKMIADKAGHPLDRLEGAQDE